MASNDKLLREIRSNYDYALDAWREIREEGKTDMRYLAGDPWPAEERKAREAAKRPCIALDELNQYVHQLVNDVRINKRAIRVLPKGSGATDQTAETDQGIIRQIEYASKAQAAYRTAFEGAAQRGYGFARISKRWVPGKFYQELVIKRIPNPDSVLIDPDYTEADCSDMGFAFIHERMRLQKFRDRWPKASVKSFDQELMREAPKWVSEHDVMVAEYWRRAKSTRQLLLLGDNAGSICYDDDLPEGAVIQDTSIIIPGLASIPIVNHREEDKYVVTQYITNGVEVLETTKWDGSYIPIGVCLGKEMYVDKGDGERRLLFSLTRLARDPYMLYCYYRTAEMEVAGQSPKVPWVGYEGQFEGHEDEWANANRAPVAYLQAKPVLDITGGQVLPLPTRNVWEPPIQALELGAEAARRAIQSAVGMYNTSVGKHDTNVQSGVALKELDQQSSQGSFHFIDNFNGFLEHMGRMIEELIDATYDTEGREVAIRKENEEHSLIKLNQVYQDPKTGEERHYPMDVGEHDVTVTTGPSSDSQRDEAQQFMEALAANEAIFPRIADLVVKLRNLGPIGDEIAKRLTPPDVAAQEQGQQQIPPQVQQRLQQTEQLLEAMTERIKQLTDTLNTKQIELNSKEKVEFAKIESNERIAAQAEETKRTIALAQIEATRGLALLEQQLAEVRSRIDQLNAREMQAGQQEHEASMQASDQAHALEQQEHQAQMQASQQEHEQNMALMGHHAALEQQEQAAALQPEPAGDESSEAA